MDHSTLPKLRVYTYLYLFANEAVMRRAMRMYDLTPEATADIWERTFYVPLLDEKLQTPVSVPGLLVRRRTRGTGLPTAKRWDVGALAIYVVDPDTYEVTSVYKFQDDHALLDKYSESSLYAHIRTQMPPNAKVYVGSWFDGRREDRIDRKGVTAMLRKHSAGVISGAYEDRDLVEELAILFGVELPKRYMNTILAAHGASLNDIARYLEATRMPMQRDMLALIDQMKHFRLDLREYETVRNRLINAGGGVQDIATDRRPQLAMWAAKWAMRNHVDISHDRIMDLVDRGSLFNLIQALDNPVEFVLKDWKIPAIKTGLVVRDVHSGDWFLLTHRIGTTEMVERKMHIPESSCLYTIGMNTMMNVPAEMDATRCYDEQDANYRLAKYYRDQLATVYL